MDEKDYIELQNLLVRLRVMLLKEYSKKDLKGRDKIVKNIRAVDTLRKNVEFEIKE